MKVAVAKETYPHERRVALVPAAVPALAKLGLEVLVETNAGAQAGYADDQYRDKGARIVGSRAEAFAADIILQVRSLGANPEAGRADLELIRPGQIVVGMCDPLGVPEAIREMAARGVTQFALELIPRITRGQAMDVLSSQATVAGYQAVLMAALELPKMFPMMMTAAGTLSPARTFVIGAGVAGLQAIATAKRLGAVVHAYDVRPAVKEQCESLGARFVEMELEAAESEDAGGYAKQMDEDFYRRQRELMAKVVADSDVVITTAAIPGKPSPRLITADAVRRMVPGSVIIDLAAERGGNCELTRADERVCENGVTILGPTNLPSELPYHASQMFANNCVKFLQNLATKENQIEVNPEDEIVAGTLVARGGEVVHPRIRELLGLAPREKEPPDSTTDGEPESETATPEETKS
jgi:NAD(P) transhydrogenase subunit alpha